MVSFYHLSPFKKLENSNLEFVAAYDIDEKNLKNVSKRHNLTPYQNLDQFFSHDMDAVLILVPHHLHTSMVLAAAKAKKHILCEKPMAISIEDCDRMIQVTKKAGVKFMIAENHVFLPAHRMIKDFIDRGFIGDIFLGSTYEGAYVNQEEFLNPDVWHFTYDKGGGGVLMDQGVHKFAMLNWMLGDIDTIQCNLGKMINSPPAKGEDNASAILHYKNGAMINLQVSSTTIHPLTNRTELHGTKGSIIEDHAWNDPISIFTQHPDAEKRNEFFSPQVEHGPFPKYYTIAAREEDMYFADCILNRKTPWFTPEQSKKTVECVWLAYLAAKNKSQVSYEELQDFLKDHKSTEILENIDAVIRKNYTHLRW